MKARPHTASDFPAIAELRWLLMTDDGRSPSQQRLQDFVVSYQRHLALEDGKAATAHWLLDDGRHVAGVMTVRIVKKKPSLAKGPECWGNLTNVFVIPLERNRGHGTRLLEAVKSWARDSGLELLVVWPSEASYPFYRRAGFTGRDDPMQLLLRDDGS